MTPLRSMCAAAALFCAVTSTAYAQSNTVKDEIEDLKARLSQLEQAYVERAFSCYEQKCSCTGNDDCFHLGSTDLCGKWDDCPNNTCTCTKKK
jgi:hypothetical protein